MSKATRLMDLLQLLRRRRRAAQGEEIARELGVSLRTAYRDISALRELGVPVQGEAGVGFRLCSGYEVPPLMFTAQELEALALGARWVSSRAGSALGKAARDALAKVEAALPASLRPVLEENSLLVAPLPVPAVDEDFLALARTAIREERKLAIVYRDADGTVTSRTVWPLTLGFLEKVLILAARCELRGDFRHFRADRMLSWKLGERYPEARSSLLQAWSAARGYVLETLGDC
jgi:predicted DNA-binding transcriptional regulator YafY